MHRYVSILPNDLVNTDATVMTLTLEVLTALLQSEHSCEEQMFKIKQEI